MGGHNCSRHGHGHGQGVGGQTHEGKKFDWKTVLGILGVIASTIGHTASISSLITSFLPGHDENNCNTDFFSDTNRWVTLGVGVLAVIINSLATWVHAKIDQSNQPGFEKVTVNSAHEGMSLLGNSDQSRNLTMWQKLCVISDMLAHILDSFSALGLTVSIFNPATAYRIVGYGLSGIYATLTNLSAYRSCKAQLLDALHPVVVTQGVGPETHRASP